MDRTGAVKPFKIKPVEIFGIHGYYDMSAIEPFVADLLETGIFGSVEEKTFLRVRERTLDVGKLPNVEEAAFLTGFCLGLEVRGPKFQRIVEPAIAERADNERQEFVMRHHGARTAVLSISSANKIAKQCIYMFHEAVGTRRFWTSDTPCWMWLQRGDSFTPMTDHALAKKATEEGSSTRWLCSITPRFALEIVPFKNDDLREVRHDRCDNARTDDINTCIIEVAERWLVKPPR